MTDPRVERYATLLIDTCLGVERGWQVLVWGMPLARPLLEEVTRQLGRRGAYPLLRLTFGGGLVYHRDWVRHAPLDVLAEPASIDEHAFQHCDGLIAISAPENTRDGSDIAAERMSAVQAAYRPATERINSSVIPWVMCWYPTPALAQDAGMTGPEFEDFLFDACLRDWEAEHERMERHAALFDARGGGAHRRRRHGSQALARRPPDGGRRRDREHAGRGVLRMPGRDLGRGHDRLHRVPRDLERPRRARHPASLLGGRVVDASAETDEDFLLATLDTDEGARRIGELGIGCNPAITRYMRNTHFDEKIDGTVHIAIGAGFADLGGTNESAIHWDMVKDLRSGGRIEIDGRVVQENGAWVT